jgi:hypothetical protein
MQTAWYSHLVAGRVVHPRLRVCFAMLAGLAPLHHERLSARGGATGPVDARITLDVSSYGPSAVDAVVRRLGVDALVNGSDRPVAGPAELPGAGPLARAVRRSNPLRLLSRHDRPQEVAA